MTKQEAIKILKGICHNCTLFPHCVYKKPDCFRAISMAIEALQRGLENVNADSCSEKPNRSDVVYRQDVIGMIQGVPISSGTAKAMLIFRAKELPSAQTETFEWCHDCKEYDQEQHCCHRWTKQIRKTVAELEADYPQAMKDELEYWKKRAEEAEADYIRITEGERERGCDECVFKPFKQFQPERKGRWIDQDDGAYYPVECSECRKIPLFDVDGDYVLSKFCPNCGSYNGGEEECMKVQ